jgi:hypothetical protein
MVGVVSNDLFHLFYVILFYLSYSLTSLFANFSRLPRQVLLQLVLEDVHLMLVARAQELDQEAQ